MGGVKVVRVYSTSTFSEHNSRISAGYMSRLLVVELEQSSTGWLLHGSAAVDIEGRSYGPRLLSSPTDRQQPERMIFEVPLEAVIWSLRLCQVVAIQDSPLEE